MSKPRNFRAFVPVILNGKVVQWYYERGELRICIEIPMRHYPMGSHKWKVKYVSVNFDRRTRTHQPYYISNDCSFDFANEVFYVCENPRISFEEGNIPVIK